VRYETAWRWFKAGKIKGRQLDTGTIIVTEDFDEPVEVDVIVVVYARVSANENRPNLDTQAERLSAYCAAKGWKVHKVVKEVGSGINDGRKKLLAILADSHRSGRSSHFARLSGFCQLPCRELAGASQAA
jgi:putative resolvase